MLIEQREKVRVCAYGEVFSVHIHNNTGLRSVSIAANSWRVRSAPCEKIAVMIVQSAKELPIELCMVDVHSVTVFQSTARG